MSDAPHSNLHLLEDPEFKDLARRKNTFTLQLTAVTLILYYGFILLIAFKRDLFAAKVAGNVTFGIALGIRVVLSCWILTGIYVRWANRDYEPVVAPIQENAKQRPSHVGRGLLLLLLLWDQ